MPINQITTISFKKWIFTNRENRSILLIVGLLIVLQCIGYKCFYPYPNLINESYIYINSAFNNLSIDYRPIGYSKFLRLFSCFTSSQLLLVIFQYFLLQLTLLYFLFSVMYFLSLGKWAFRILVAISVMNPFLLHVSNLISSDPLFVSLSLIWLTNLIWIIFQPTKIMFLLHGVVLLLAIMTQNNAIYYPFISILVISLSNTTTKQKVKSIALIILLLTMFISNTQIRYKKDIGNVQFSPLNSWQIAANALAAYSHASTNDQITTVPKKFRRLHSIVNQYMDSLRRLPHKSRIESATHYLRSDKSPLINYVSQWKKDSVNGDFKRWALVAPLYKAYGWYLINKHNNLYIKYHIFPNFIKYFTPSSENLGEYKIEGKNINLLNANWFNLKSKVISRHEDSQLTIITPAIPGIVSTLYLFSFIGFICIGGYKRCSHSTKTLLWYSALVWISDVLVSTLATPIVIRYQVFTTVISIVFGLILANIIIGEYLLLRQSHNSKSLVKPNVSLK